MGSVVLLVRLTNFLKVAGPKPKPDPDAKLDKTEEVYILMGDQLLNEI